MVVEQKYNKKLWSLVWITVEWIENIKGGGRYYLVEEEK